MGRGFYFILNEFEFICKIFNLVGGFSGGFWLDRVIIEGLVGLGFLLFLVWIVILYRVFNVRCVKN